MANWNASSTLVLMPNNIQQIVSMIPTASGNETTGTTKGLVPGATSGDITSGKFLRADATWASPGSASQTYIHQQSSAASIWTIAHNLGRNPIVRVFSVGGQEIEADIININLNVVQINFVVPVVGSAICV